MPEYRAPGVYVEELAGAPPPVTPVETAIPVFVGYTAKVLARGGARTDRQALYIDSFATYTRLCGQTPLHDASVTVTKRIDASGGLLGIRVDWAAFEPVPRHFLAYAVQLYFVNGGTGCFVWSLGRYRKPRKADFLAALADMEAIEGPTLLVMPDAALLDGGDHAEVLDAALASAARRGDRFVIADVPRAVAGAIDSVAAVHGTFRAAITGDPTVLRYGAAYYPYLDTTLPLRRTDRRTRLATFDVVTVAPDGGESTAPHPEFAGSSLVARLARSEPEVYRAIKAFVGQARAAVPPSGAVAGVYARVDRQHGVWKAPAGEVLLQIARPAIAVDDRLQDALNVDPATGKSVNAIRAFTGRGTLVWGARTLAGNDNEWRYVNVRRLAIFLEQSLQRSLQWAVFEPNDANTWSRLRAAVETFLTGLWREGALQGTKPEQAFTVAVGLGSTMTQADIDSGRMIVQVGFAPVRPAEFILLRILLQQPGP